MGQGSMTALISAFARAYHRKLGGALVFDDCVAEKLFRAEEFAGIEGHMAGGIGFFNPEFSGTTEEALGWVVCDQLAPSPLGRAAFAEGALENAVHLGTRQYIMLAAGYDTFCCRQPDWARKIAVIELDLPDTSREKRRRIAEAGIFVPGNVAFVEADLADSGWMGALAACPAFDPSATAFVSLLGFAYYVEKDAFRALVGALGAMIPEGSAIAFDYPDDLHVTDQAGARARKQARLMQGAGDPPCAGYAQRELEELLDERGFLVCEHLTPAEITQRFFAGYNAMHPSCPMAAMDNVAYCLAVKRRT